MALAERPNRLYVSMKDPDSGECLHATLLDITPRVLRDKLIADPELNVLPKRKDARRFKKSLQRAGK